MPTGRSASRVEHPSVHKQALRLQASYMFQRSNILPGFVRHWKKPMPKQCRYGTECPFFPKKTPPATNSSQPAASFFVGVFDNLFGVCDTGRMRCSTLKDPRQTTQARFREPFRLSRAAVGGGRRRPTPPARNLSARLWGKATNERQQSSGERVDHAPILDPDPAGSQWIPEGRDTLRYQRPSVPRRGGRGDPTEVELSTSRFRSLCITPGRVRARARARARALPRVPTGTSRTCPARPFGRTCSTGSRSRSPPTITFSTSRTWWPTSTSGERSASSFESTTTVGRDSRPRLSATTSTP
mmetsp:Transcript_19562/g.45466  ORF Transcript_19562/g.45466 Transcript_19562/m.45466 type:complete len:299 (-) Transcript_19562:8458-9354(-)